MKLPLIPMALSFKYTQSVSSKNYIFIAIIYIVSRDSSVGIATGYKLDKPASITGSARIFSPPQRPDRLWGPHSLLSNGYRGPFPVG
jgi:hypothetical protein